MRTYFFFSRCLPPRTTVLYLLLFHPSLLLLQRPTSASLLPRGKGAFRLSNGPRWLLPHLKARRTDFSLSSLMSLFTHFSHLSCRFCNPGRGAPSSIIDSRELESIDCRAAQSFSLLESLPPRFTSPPLGEVRFSVILAHLLPLFACFALRRAFLRPFDVPCLNRFACFLFLLVAVLRCVLFPVSVSPGGADWTSACSAMNVYKFFFYQSTRSILHFGTPLVLPTQAYSRRVLSYCRRDGFSVLFNNSGCLFLHASIPAFESAPSSAESLFDGHNKFYLTKPEMLHLT